MAMILRPQIDLNNDRWAELSAKYKLDSVISMTRIQALWRRIRACSSPAIWYELQGREQVMAAVTLGQGIDRLQEEWFSHGQLLDAYAADCLSMEALQCLYRVLEDELLRQGLFISRYVFAEAGESTESGSSVEVIKILSPDIHLTAEGMMQPLKSVVYRGILSENAGERCGTICGDCGRGDCPHRQSLHMDNYRETGDIKFSYGYQRIFGQK